MDVQDVLGVELVVEGFRLRIGLLGAVWAGGLVHSWSDWATAVLGIVWAERCSAHWAGVVSDDAFDSFDQAHVASFVCLAVRGRG
jgi:hypothetical protein